MATQNPLEQEGTYPLPEAQVDRFMLKIKVDYPSVEEEKQIVKDVSFGKVAKLQSILNTKKIAFIRSQIESVLYG